MKKNLIILISAVIVYVTSVGISYALFSKDALGLAVTQVVPTPSFSSNEKVSFNTAEPKTEPCPLNGVLYSKDQKAWWDTHRPLGVMIENSIDARPQSGLSYADVVYESVAEGGITRFLSLYYCQPSVQVGPVRSARVYFLTWLSEYGMYPLYTHVGGANASGDADALGMIDSLGWSGYNDLNQFSIGYPTFWRDYNRQGHEVATEHTMYSTTGKLWDFAKSDRHLTNVDKNGDNWDKTFTPYQFKDDAVPPARGNVQAIHMTFWGEDEYAVDWVYDSQNNVYLRSNGGQKQIDKDTNKQLSAKNIVVLDMQESHANDGYDNNVHLLYQTTGTGKAQIFMDGKEVKGSWKKDTRTGRTSVYDATGSQIQFDRGLIWFSVLPQVGTLTVK